MHIEQLENIHIYILLHELNRNFIDGIRDILFFDHQMLRHIAEQGELLLVLVGHGLLAATDQHIRNDADRSQYSHRLL